MFCSHWFSSRGRSAADVETRAKELKLSAPVQKPIKQPTKEISLPSSGGLLWDPDDGDENDDKWNSRSRVVKQSDLSLGQQVETRKLLKKNPVSRGLDDGDEDDLFGENEVSIDRSSHTRVKSSMIIDSDED